MEDLQVRASLVGICSSREVTAKMEIVKGSAVLTYRSGRESGVEKNIFHKNNTSQLMRFVILMKGGGYYMLLHSTSVFSFVKISYSFFPIHNDPIASDSAKQETKGTEWIFYSNYKKCNCLQRPARCS